MEYLPDDDASAFIRLKRAFAPVCWIGSSRRRRSASARRRLWATRNSQPVEFALAVLDADESDGLAGEAWSEFRPLCKPLAWSGWRGVECLNSHQLTVVMPSGCATSRSSRSRWRC